MRNAYYKTKGKLQRNLSSPQLKVIEAEAIR